MQPQETHSEAPPMIVETQSETSTQPQPEIHTKKIPRQRHFLILFFFSFMWGTFGVDRMYMGFYGSGILKLLTLGGFGFWTLSDFIIIMTGTFRDKEGRVALQFDEYKKFASRTLLWFTIIVGAVILINGVLLILSITQLMGSFHSGGTGGIPGLSQLTGGSNNSQINNLLGQ